MGSVGVTCFFLAWLVGWLVGVGCVVSAPEVHLLLLELRVSIKNRLWDRRKVSWWCWEGFDLFEVILLMPSTEEGEIREPQLFLLALQLCEELPIRKRLKRRTQGSLEMKIPFEDFFFEPLVSHKHTLTHPNFLIDRHVVVNMETHAVEATTDYSLP